jgi:5-formyltetrahydrofolate cyclo-ligase
LRQKWVRLLSNSFLIPLEYPAWRPREKLVDDVWNTPVPERRYIVITHAMLAPFVGFDRQYFDRTLAALAPRPLAIGVGFELSQIETIYPQPFDIPMDVIVNESCIRRGRADLADL